MTGPITLITGASSGIGADLAREHARAGGSLVLVARRRERLEELAAELADRHDAEALILARDLTAPDAAGALHRDIAERGLEVDHLINNAGFGGLGLFHEIAPERHEAMIQLNVLALTQLTRFFLPEMIARGSGRVLNVASVAGFVPGPWQAAYYATKAYVLSLTEALAVELRGTGVTVTALCPGPTTTEFAEQAGADRLKLFESGTATSADVAAYGYRAMLRGKTVAIHGASNRMVPTLLRVLPRGVPARMVERVQRGR
ncbi:SDR family NAD(P)-dependent oxidoreductase [bacterium]|nr:SDR family NAD(P)-dependent oxidoreductase [bacterium]